MAEFSSLDHGIYCVDALYVKPQVASIYLMRQGDQVAIIETGTCHSVANLLATMTQLGIDRAQVRYVIPTHVHLDHAGGAGEMMRQFEQAQLLIHPRGAAHMIDPQRLVAGTKAVYGEAAFARLYGEILPIPEQRVVVVEDLDCIELNSRKLIFFDTQGHARHHFCIYDETSDGVFTGDSFGVCYPPMKVLRRGLIPSTPPSQFDPPALHHSVNRIMSFQPQRLYLTHYGEFLDPAASLDSFERWIDQYVEVCNSLEPSQAQDDAALQALLEQTVLEAICDADARSEMAAVIGNDLRLNAQGLAHWWRQAQHG